MKKILKMKRAMLMAILIIVLALLVQGVAFATVASTNQSNSTGLNLDALKILDSTTGILGGTDSLLNLDKTLSTITGLTGVLGQDSSLLNTGDALGTVTGVVGTVGSTIETTGGLLPAITNSLGDTVTKTGASVGNLVTDTTGVLGKTLKDVGNTGGSLVTGVGKNVTNVTATGSGTSTQPAEKKRVVVTFKVGSKHYTINNKPSVMDVIPYIKNNRCYLPIRFVGYSLGIGPKNINWELSSGKATLTKGDTTVQVVVGNNTMLVNNTAIKIDAPAELILPGRVMLPYRWIAEAFGATVGWDQNNKIVTVEYYE